RGSKDRPAPPVDQSREIRQRAGFEERIEDAPVGAVPADREDTGHRIKATIAVRSVYVPGMGARRTSAKSPQATVNALASSPASGGVRWGAPGTKAEPCGGTSASFRGRPGS